MLPEILPDANSQVRAIAMAAPVRLLEVETVFEALARVRAEPGTNDVVYFYVTDSADRLVGVAPVRKLLLAEPSTLVGELMIHPVLSVTESEPFGNALSLLTRNRLLALPVIDQDGKLVGVLNVSGATHALMEIERRESDATLFQTIGIRPGRERAILASLAVGLALAVVAAQFDGVLRRAAVVAYFIPAVLTVAGAAAMWAVPRSLESVQWTRRKRVRMSDLRRPLALGTAGAAFAGLCVELCLGLPALAFSVACSLAAAVASGLTLGYSVPRLVHRWQLDLNIASGPIVRAMADIVALTFYLAASTLLL